ncbi:ureidoglycolate lyase [Rubrimonas cliftonensis]|uniref:Ureidoglycolate lyase n=1 Tax=Rubrimonas cliftonensis TaxID=89524 RepID=A0A1H3WUB5_9RHOB|nr:ureidoglycolate lyase [Rubrimonas cliftonensis]SDZ90745.1 ureidoglycolate lyase [Rubrimonas cliftonensis]
MRAISIEPLTAAAFAPFGEPLVPPISAGRAFFEGALASRREAARPSLSLSRVEAAASLPVEARRMERHQFSSQSFVPMGDLAMLVIVAPHAPQGGPDVSAARAFLAEGGVGVTYGADVWHHPLTLLAAPASLAVLMWRDGGPGDEEFVDVEPFLVRG